MYLLLFVKCYNGVKHEFRRSQKTIRLSSFESKLVLFPKLSKVSTSVGSAHEVYVAWHGASGLQVHRHRSVTGLHVVLGHSSPYERR